LKLYGFIVDDKTTGVRLNWQINSNKIMIMTVTIELHALLIIRRNAKFATNDVPADNRERQTTNQRDIRDKRFREF